MSRFFALDLVVEEDVLGNRKVGAQRELLVDDDDALGLAVADVAERHRLALEDDVALVAAVRVDPAQHVHEGGLAGAVLAADGVDLAAPDREGHVLSALTPGKVFVIDRISRMFVATAVTCLPPAQSVHKV